MSIDKTTEGQTININDENFQPTLTVISNNDITQFSTRVIESFLSGGKKIGMYLFGNDPTVVFYMGVESIADSTTIFGLVDVDSNNIFDIDGNRIYVE